MRGIHQEKAIALLNELTPRPSAGAALAMGLLSGAVMTLFAGDRGVRLVEISADGGRTWQPAQVRRALSPYTWVLWTAHWLPPAPRTYDLAVRATDGRGEVQPPYESPSAPDGATGHHTIVVVIKAPRT